MKASVARGSGADLVAAFARLRVDLHAYLARRLPDPDLADDLVQDLFLKALRAERAGRRIGHPRAWLYAASRTLLADHYRAPLLRSLPLDEQQPQPRGEDPGRHQALADCLRPLIERLPALYRDTLIATEFQGRRMRELAAAEGVSVSAVKSRAARGRSRLREMLLECCSVEWRDGLVSDYRARRTEAAGQGCDRACG